MKVLIFIHSLKNGGAERVAANLANYWTQQGWDMTVATLTRPDTDAYTLNPSIKRIVLPVGNEMVRPNILVSSYKQLRCIFALRRLLRQVNPDIALGMITEAVVVLALAAWGLPKTRSVGAEHTHPPQLPLPNRFKILRHYTYGLLDVAMALTREGAEWMRHNTLARRVEYIPNAVFLPLPLEEPRLVPGTVVGDDKQILLAGGRLATEKGFDLLIEAFSHLAHQYPEWVLVILGEGHLRPRLEQQINGLGLEKRVLMPGRTGNMAEWYSSADLFVMSSRCEGFPMTLLEAMSHGLAAVSFDCDTGPRDIIRHEVDGLLVPAGQVNLLKEALERLMQHPHERQRMAIKAQEVKERFSVEKISGKWEKLFVQLCQ